MCPLVHERSAVEPRKQSTFRLRIALLECVLEHAVPYSPGCFSKESLPAGARLWEAEEAKRGNGPTARTECDPLS